MSEKYDDPNWQCISSLAVVDFLGTIFAGIGEREEISKSWSLQKIGLTMHLFTITACIGQKFNN